MRLEDLRAEVRPRRSWEAMDLGLRLLQSDAKPIAQLWVALVLPLAIVVYFIADALVGPTWAAVAVWWIKPLFDRIPLLVLSQSLFGAVSSFKENAATVLSLWRQHAFKALFTRRINLSRSFLLPVWQLERLEGGDYTQRCAVLMRSGDDANHASWLLIVCLHLESFLVFAGLVLIQMLIPEGVEYNVLDAVAETEVTDGASDLLFLLWLLAVSIIEPFYAACGFALYLNRRSHLEAWDIELGFRRLAQRLRSSVAGIVLVIPVALATAGAFIPGSLQANAPASEFEQESEQVEGKLPGPGLEAATVDPEIAALPRKEELDDAWCTDLQADLQKLRESDSEAKQLLGDIYAQEVTAQCALGSRWSYIEDVEIDENDDDWDLGFLSDLLKFLFDGDESGVSVADFVEFVLWLLAFVGLMFALRLLIHAIGQYQQARRSTPPELPLDQLFGLDLRPESLPDDPISAARALWGAGEARPAVSLLYRSALVGLMHNFSLVFQKSATERECQQLVQQQLPNTSLERIFTDLTRVWELTAYRSTPPNDAVFEAICLNWPFQETTAPTSSDKEAD